MMTRQAQPAIARIQRSTRRPFYRFFAIGFAAGALFVGATMDTGMGETIANGVVPVAEAQAAR